MRLLLSVRQPNTTWYQKMADSNFNALAFDPMVWEGNLAENWKKYVQGYELHVLALGKKEAADEVRCAMLLCRVGQEGMKLYNSFTFTSPADKLKTAEVIKKFEEFCTPKTNRVYERYKFWSRHRSKYETFGVYLTDLKKLADSCEFGDQRESLIVDQLVLI